MSEFPRDSALLFALQIVESDVVQGVELPPDQIDLLLRLQENSELASVSPKTLDDAISAGLVQVDSSGQWSLSVDGSKTLAILRNGANNLRNLCVDWFSARRDMGHGQRNAVTEFNQYDRALCKLRLVEFGPLFGILRDPSSVQRISPNSSRSQQFIARILSSAVSERGETSRPSPIEARFYAEYISASAQARSASNMEGVQARHLHVLVDTNVLMALVGANEAWQCDVVEAAWKYLRHQNPESAIKFHVTRRTIDEARNAMTSASAEITRLHVKLSLEEKLEKEDIEQLSPISRLLLNIAEGPNLLDLSDFVIAKLLGLRSPLKPIDDWHPQIINEKDMVCDDDLDELIDIIRKKSGPPLRSLAQDQHDVTLLYVANCLNSDAKTREPAHRSQISATGERWVIWTLHGALREFAVRLEMPGDLVTFGYTITAVADSILQENRSVQAWRDSYRLIMSGTKAQSKMGDIPQLIKSTLSSWNEMGQSIPRPSTAMLPLSVLLDDGGLQPKWVDATMDFAYSAGGHDTRRLQMLREKQYPATRLRLPIHSVTHVDLPWTVALEDPRVVTFSHVPDQRTSLAQIRRISMTRPQVHDAIIVDFCDYSNRIEHLFAERSFIARDHLADQISRTIIRLAIDVPELTRRVGKLDKLKNKVLVLHTGWAERYLQPGNDLSDLAWELRHPWLVHPWLTTSAVDTILDYGVVGVAVDCPMVDCPLYLCYPSEDRPEILEVLVRVFKHRFDSDLASGQNQSNDRGFLLDSHAQPVHTRLLPRGRLLFENLFIRAKDLYHSYKNQTHFLAQMVMLPLDVPTLMDGVVCKVYIGSRSEA